MDAAGKQGLGVILRVGYTWDYASPESALSRYEGLLYDPQLKAAWISYAERLYKQVSAYETSAAAFSPGKISGISRKMQPDMEMGLPDAEWQSCADIRIT